jgi:NAD(P)-dependent dehydrogenase (short-subunit alcohol dehydrogenase family)
MHLNRKVFAEQGYRVALIARNAEHLKAYASKLQSDGGEVSNPFSILARSEFISNNFQAAPFPIAAYDESSLTSAFKSIAEQWPDSALRVAVWNAGYGVWKPFLQITDAEVEESLNANVRAAFTFSRLSILAFQKNALNGLGKRGSLIFTSATAAWRGNTTTSAFAAGKFGLRALSQSLNKEFGKENIHVAHVSFSERSVDKVAR